MGYWSTRGLRGNTLEEYINLTNDYYMHKGLAVIQKIPTPIKPVQIDKDNKTITLAYFDQQSTVDYIGTVQGVPVCFDAKDTERKSLPISHIHSHQIEFMKRFEEQRGVSFLLVHFSFCDKYFFLPFPVLEEYYLESQNGGRKSIPFDAFEQKYEIVSKGSARLHYLPALQTYLEDSPS